MTERIVTHDSRHAAPQLRQQLPVLPGHDRAVPVAQVPGLRWTPFTSPPRSSSAPTWTPSSATTNGCSPQRPCRGFRWPAPVAG